LKKYLLGTLLAPFLLAACTATAKQPVNVWVGFSPGGGYDASARVFAKYFSRYLPGNPDVVVVNKPGAGTAKLVGYMYRAVPATRMDIAFFHPAVMQMAVYGKRKIRFKPTEFKYIGNMYTDVNSCGVWKGAGQKIRTFADLKAAKNPIIFGSASPNSTMSTYPLFLKNVLGANIKVIQGYRGTRKAMRAMQAGEIHGACGFFESSIRSSYAQHWKSGLLNSVVQLDINRKAKMFSKATALSSLLKTEEERQMAQFVFGIDVLSRPVLASPRARPADVSILRKAFMDTMRDPELKAEVKRRFGVVTNPMSGEKVQKFFVDMQATPRQIVNRVWQMTRPSK
jgi:tripartite-type tricarboxylate transporter receptor subunit TctC